MNDLLVKLAFLPSKMTAIIAVVVGGLFYISPFYDDGSSLVGQIAALRAELAAEEDKKVKTQQILSERDRLQEILSKLTERYEELSRKIPSELSSSEVNRQINDLIQAAKLRSIERKPLPEENIGILDEIPYELNLSGTFNDIGQFIYLISTSERVMLIKSFTLDPSEPYNGQIGFRVVMAAYKLSANPDLSKLTTPGER